MVHYDGSLQQCCRDGELAFSYGSLNKETFQEIWNSEAIRSMRLSLLKDAPVPQCAVCYQEEASGLESLRLSSNRNFRHLFHWVDKTGTKGEMPLDSIKYVGLRLSNECNQRCRTCSPGNSTGWTNDGQALAGRALKRGAQHAFLNTEKAASIFEALVPTIEEVYFAGGEPLLQSEHYQFLKVLLKEGKSSVHLHYNTSLAVLSRGKESALELLDKFPHVTLSVSFDTFGAAHDVLRSGSSWKEVHSNLELIRERLPHIKITINPTLSIINSYDITRAILYWVSNGILNGATPLSINLLQHPSFLSFTVLSRDEKAKLIGHYQNFIATSTLTMSSEMHSDICLQLEPIIAALGTLDYSVDDRISFRNMTFQLDKLRSERLIDAFPDLFNILYEAVPKD